MVNLTSHLADHSQLATSGGWLERLEPSIQAEHYRRLAAAAVIREQESEESELREARVHHVFITFLACFLTFSSHFLSQRWHLCRMGVGHA